MCLRLATLVVARTLTMAFQPSLDQWMVAHEEGVCGAPLLATCPLRCQVYTDDVTKLHVGEVEETAGCFRIYNQLMCGSLADGGFAQNKPKQESLLHLCGQGSRAGSQRVERGEVAFVGKVKPAVNCWAAYSCKFLATGQSWRRVDKRWQNRTTAWGRFGTTAHLIGSNRVHSFLQVYWLSTEEGEPAGVGGTGVALELMIDEDGLHEIAKRQEGNAW